VHLAVWIVAVLLAAGCVTGGVIKLVVPKEKFPEGGWTDDASAGAVKVIGLLEVAAGVGLVMPDLDGGERCQP
jgi:hypothetical protein